MTNNRKGICKYYFETVISYGKRMINKLLIILFFVILSIFPVFAQEKIVDNISVNLGILSWEEIQKGIKEKPATHTEEFHRKMARAMSEMHGGGFKGAYHVMIMLKDKTSGAQIANEDVWITASAKTGPEEITHKLKPMTMDGYSGYGEFFKLTFQGPYIFRVKIRRKSLEPPGGITYSVEFERVLPLK